MAKDSFILGMTRGSVGNITVRRTDGRTVISAKPTTVRNPRSYAQAEVRMRMSAVSKFYSPLSTVLEQGVQSKTTLRSQSDFTSAAIRTMQEGGYSVHKQLGWCPLPFRLSKGSVPPVVLTKSGSWAQTTNSFDIDDGFGALTGNIETIGDLASLIKSRHNVPVKRFQLTFVAAYKQQVSDNVWVFYPYAERLAVDVDSTDTLGAIGRFSISGTGGDDTAALVISGSANNYAVGAAIIISYWDGKKWVRSTTDLLVSPEELAASRAAYEQNVASFMDSSTVNAPAGTVYLDGYTPGEQQGGGGGISLDWGSLPVFINGTRVAGVTILNPATVTSGANTLMGVALSDGRTLAVTGDERTNTYGKGITVGGEAVAVEGLAETGVQFGSMSSYELAAYLSLYYDVPMSAIMGG